MGEGALEEDSSTCESEAWEVAVRGLEFTLNHRVLNGIPEEHPRALPAGLLSVRIVMQQNTEYLSDLMLEEPEVDTVFPLL